MGRDVRKYQIKRTNLSTMPFNISTTPSRMTQLIYTGLKDGLNLTHLTVPRRRNCQNTQEKLKYFTNQLPTAKILHRNFPDLMRDTQRLCPLCYGYFPCFLRWMTALKLGLCVMRDRWLLVDLIQLLVLQLFNMTIACV